MQAVQTRGDCAQSGAKRCPDVDSVAKDRSGAGDNECAEMSKNGKLRPLLVGPRLSFWEKVRHGEAKTEAELATVKFQNFNNKYARGGPNEIFLDMSKSGRSVSVLFRRAAASICMSTWMPAAEPS